MNDKIVHDAASLLPPEKRDVFLTRVKAILLHRQKFTDADVAAAVEATLARLVQTPHHSAPTPSGARV